MKNIRNLVVELIHEIWKCTDSVICTSKFQERNKIWEL